MTTPKETVLPVGWHLAKIGDLFDSWGGHTPSKSNKSYWGEGLPWVSSKDVKTSRLATITHTVTRKAVEETGLKVCPTGSVLVVVRSGILAHTLPVSITKKPVTINQDLKAFYSEEPLLNEWLALFLRMSAHELLASSRRDGTTVQSVQYPLLKNTLMPVPPLEQRRRIIEALEKAFHKQASIPPHLDTARRAIERFRQAVLAAACHGRLTADWRREQLNLGPSAVSPLGTFTADATKVTAPYHRGVELPEGWTVAPIKTLFRIQNGRAFPSKQYTSIGIRLLRPGNLHKDGTVDWGADRTVSLPWTWADQFPQYVLGRGELLMNLTAQSLKDEFLGRVCLKEDDEPALLNQRIARFSNLSDFDVRPYALIYFKSPFFRRFVNGLDSGTLIRHMHSRQVESHLMLVPPPEEQIEIVGRVKQLLRLAVDLQRRIEAAKSQVDRTSQAVLAKAFRGELIPADTAAANGEPIPEGASR